MKRRFAAPAGTSPRLRMRRGWCMVGTAENHVAPWSLAIGQNVIGSNLGGTTTTPPERNVAIVDAMRPWIWNSGRTHRATSAGPRSYEAAMLSTEAKRFLWRSG